MKDKAQINIQIDAELKMKFVEVIREMHSSEGTPKSISAFMVNELIIPTVNSKTTLRNELK